MNFADELMLMPDCTQPMSCKKQYTKKSGRSNKILIKNCRDRYRLYCEILKGTGLCFSFVKLIYRLKTFFD